MKLILGDSKEKLKEIASNSIDLICCDPPYQLDSIRSRFGKPGSAPAKDGVYARTAKGFMGKQWDVLPPVEVWRECLRVLKPGAFAFIMTTPRQDSLCQILGDLSEAGFMMGFSSIYWTYATGFPKAGNIAKLVDKRLKVTPKTIAVKKQKGAKFKLAQEQMDNMGFNDPDRTEFKITEATSKMAKELDGSYGGFQPKPAIEIILVCMKPLSEKTYIAQALKNGKGITYLDNCRVPYESENDKSGWSKTGADGSKGYQDTNTFKIRPITAKEIQERCVSKGRFPANLLVSADVLNDGKIFSHGKAEKPYSYKDKKYKVKGFIPDIRPNAPSNYADSGSFSRYFDLDKWWEERIKELPESVRKTFPFLIVPKASRSERNKVIIGGTGSNTFNKKCKKCGKWQRHHTGKWGEFYKKYACTCKEPDWEEPTGNKHPTVKPIKLISYLIILGSRKGDTVLDPFMGSGTTGIACKLLNRDFVGVEGEKEYMTIAKARINSTQRSLI